MKRRHDFATQLAIAASATELAGEARAVADFAELNGEPCALERELAEDLVRVAFVCMDELTRFHATHDTTKPAAPAWFLPGGEA